MNYLFKKQLIDKFINIIWWSLFLGHLIVNNFLPDFRRKKELSFGFSLISILTFLYFKEWKGTSKYLAINFIAGAFKLHNFFYNLKNVLEPLFQKIMPRCVYSFFINIQPKINVLQKIIPKSIYNFFLMLREKWNLLQTKTADYFKTKINDLMFAPRTSNAYNPRTI